MPSDTRPPIKAWKHAVNQPDACSRRSHCQVVTHLVPSNCTRAGELETTVS